ncbi:uncharacterized protein BO97DRAFT_372271 [Aspergillus homomorphus CBS 101889]|uniref:Tim44-like domain-containing protein n=1 Tax=Aspergillus homomorphus (strain CBS 101889) TaxID=1450537 RepID=A0A395HRI2_ASPHC|nr:hypothetical protein BO97DRAFT_372271 [Aspergillus homomorphus CBS 101889]RAL10551.1 hypothetical protein BO97DRAFT_372271 [Aspergillus homomorphus CBS 101889]
MASSLSKGPLSSAVRASNNPFSPIPIVSGAASCQSRSFSQSSQRSMGRLPKTIVARPPPQPSTRTKTRGMARTELPQDFGILPGTYIRPLWKDMPSIFKQPQERLRLEWLWMKTGFQNFLGVLAYCRYFNKGLPLELKERRQIAQQYHQRMYSAFAAGDTNTINKICCTGLAKDLNKRIAARPKNEKVTWSLDKYIRNPSTFWTGARVVSDRATQIPELPDSGVRQVVVRITSKQSTGKYTEPANGKTAKNSTAVAQDAKQRDCTEYLVLQKLRWTGEDTEWRVWGYTNATTVEDLSSPFFAPGLTIRERLEAMNASLGK